MQKTCLQFIQSGIAAFKQEAGQVRERSGPLGKRIPGPAEHASRQGAFKGRGE